LLCGWPEWEVINYGCPKEEGQIGEKARQSATEAQAQGQGKAAAEAEGCCGNARATA